MDDTKRSTTLGQALSRLSAVRAKQSNLGKSNSQLGTEQGDKRIPNKPKQTSQWQEFEEIPEREKESKNHSFDDSNVNMEDGEQMENGDFKLGRQSRIEVSSIASSRTSMLSGLKRPQQDGTKPSSGKLQNSGKLDLADLTFPEEEELFDQVNEMNSLNLRLFRKIPSHRYRLLV
jgi:hypothetical protein